jgi:hypothetical protein
MRPRWLKILAWLCVVGGTALGPVYWVYLNFYSGEVVARLPLASSAAGLRSPVFRLHPGQAPVGLILRAQGSFTVDPAQLPMQPPRNRYRAVLTQDERTGEPVGFVLGVKKLSDNTPSFREPLFLLNAPAAGEYRLDVATAAPPEITLTEPVLEVRANLGEADNGLAAAGILAIGFGLLILLM